MDGSPAVRKSNQGHQSPRPVDTEFKLWYITPGLAYEGNKVNGRVGLRD